MFHIKDNLFLETIHLTPTSVLMDEPVATDHFMVIDRSGSMSRSLPGLRRQLKDKLVEMIGPNDTLTLIAFSGRRECEVIFEGMPIHSLLDLRDLNARIDKHLVPTGLTCFVEPLVMVREAKWRVEDFSRAQFPNTKRAVSLFFMSDGQDNQSPSREEILRAAANLYFDATTIVEFGPYADRPFLMKMAEMSGGALIYADALPEYEPIVARYFSNKSPGAPRQLVDMEGKEAVGGFVFCLSNGEIISSTIGQDGEAYLPPLVTEAYYLTSDGDPKSVDKAYNGFEAEALYAAMSLFATRSAPDIIYPILSRLGDVALVKKFAGCFGKQEYTDFQELAKNAAFDAGGRFVDGYSATAVPDDNAYTLLDLFELLQRDPDNRLLLDHEAFQYDRIGRGKVDASFTGEDLAALDKLIGAVEIGDVDGLRGVQAHILAMLNKKPLKFMPDADLITGGYPFDKLVYNQNRANLSVQVTKKGIVDLRGAAYPPTLYAFIVDGRVNVDSLPVHLTQATLDELYALDQAGKLPEGFIRDEYGVKILSLRKLPVMNRAMSKSASASQLFAQEWELLKSKAEQKVLKYYRDQFFPVNKSAALAELLGEDSVAWLAEQGITDSGFAPKQTTADSKDFYIGKEIRVKVEGYSSLPKVEDVAKMMQKGKLNKPGALMATHIEVVDKYITDHRINPDFEADFYKWLTFRTDKAIAYTRYLMAAQAKIKFAVIVGQAGFIEFAGDSDLDSLDLIFGDETIRFHVEQKNVEVTI